MSSTSSSSAASGSTPTQSAATTHGPSIFNSSSLLFGFVFMGILIVFMAVGFFWQRVVLGRHSAFMAMFERMREKEILQNTPVLWDAHVNGEGKGAREVCWREFNKPLGVKLLPLPPLKPPASLSDKPHNSNATSASSLTTAFKRFLEWLDPRPFSNPLLPSTPPNIRIPPPPPRQPRRPIKPKSKNARSAKGKQRDDDEKKRRRREDRRVSVSVIIAMPDPQRRPSQSHVLMHESTSSGTASPLTRETVIAPPSSSDEPEQLYYELGIAEVPLRFRSFNDDDDFLGELDELDDDEDVDGDENKTDSTRVTVSAARSS